MVGQYLIFHFPQVFCDQSDGGGEDGIPGPGLLRQGGQLRCEHHPARPLQGDQGEGGLPYSNLSSIPWTSSDGLYP